ncbi:hypothetical protein T484DRAFT_1889592 [Baffinella frigidus]|nr:hypothetical protein T484DRAFT_1889592 [Cryptophyta sp. CCMP2293]
MAGRVGGALARIQNVDVKLARIQNVDVKLVQRFIYILTNFYPERLGVMCLLDAPGFFGPFCWPLLKPLLNPATADKVKFVSSRPDAAGEEALGFWVGKKCLPTSLGGEEQEDTERALASSLASPAV